MTANESRGRRRRRCALRRPGDPRCFGSAEVEVTDVYGDSRWGCPRHAALALRLVQRSRITATVRPGAGAEVRAWLNGTHP